MNERTSGSKQAMAQRATFNMIQWWKDSSRQSPPYISGAPHVHLDDIEGNKARVRLADIDGNKVRDRKNRHRRDFLKADAVFRYQTAT